MNRALTMCGLGAVVLAGVGLFQLKYEVETREKLLGQVRTDFLEDQKAIRVLRAEWSYLNSPDYLQQLTERYLSLGPTAPSQVIDSLDELPWRSPGTGRIMPSVGLVAPEPRQAPTRKHHSDMSILELANDSRGGGPVDTDNAFVQSSPDSGAGVGPDSGAGVGNE